MRGAANRPPDWRREAESRARREARSFSDYFARLLELDRLERERSYWHAFAYLFVGLAGACTLAALLAGVSSEPGWCVVFSALAACCLLVAGELEEP